MNNVDKPYVQLGIEQVDTVIHDPDYTYDADHHDRYATYETARDAALTSIEVMLDEADYDGDDHLEELERMYGLLDSSGTFTDLEKRPEYRAFLRHLAPPMTVAA